MSEQSNEEKYCLDDFIYWLGKYNDTSEKKWTQAEIACLIARAMVNFFPDTNTPY